MVIVLPVISGLISIFGLTNAFKFSNQPYDHSIGEIAFWYAHGAYCSADTINSWTSGMGSGQPENKDFQIYRTVTTSSLQAYTGWDPVNSRVIISFRGSSNFDNWLKNLDVWPGPYPTNLESGAKVHPGFWDNWKGLQTAGLTAAIQQMFSDHPGAGVLVTGHSLGGALATMCAVELGESPTYAGLDIEYIDVITFGSPRVGNQAFAQLFEEHVRTSFRIVNRYDIAATVPTKFMGYYHVGQQKWYRWQRWWWNETPKGYKGGDETCNGSGEDTACFGTDFWIDRVPIIHHHTNYFGRDWMAGVCVNGAGR